MLNTLQRYLKNAIHTTIDHERIFSNLMPHFHHHAHYRMLPMNKYIHAMHENVFMLGDWILQYVMTSTPPEKKKAFDKFLSTVLSALQTNPDSEVCLAIIQYLKIIISLHDQASDEKKTDIANALASEDYSKCLEGSSERLFYIIQQYEDSDLLSRLLSLTQLFYQQQARTFIQDKKLISNTGYEIHMVTILIKYAFQTLDIPLQTISNNHVEAQRNRLYLQTIVDWCTHVQKAWDTEFLAFAADQIFPNTFAQSDPARVVVCDLLPRKLHDNTLYVVREGESVTLSIQKKSIGPPQKSTIGKSKTKAFLASKQPENDVEITTIAIETILFGEEHETSQKRDDSAHDRLLNNLVASDYFKQSLINHLAVDQPTLLPTLKEHDLPYPSLLPDNAYELLYYLGLDEQRAESQTTRQALLLHAANAAHADASSDTKAYATKWVGAALEAIGSSLVTGFTTAAGCIPSTPTSHAHVLDAHTKLWKTSETFQAPSWLLSQYLQNDIQAQVIFFDALKSAVNGAYTQAWILGDLLPCMLTYHRSLLDKEKEKLMDIFLNHQQYKALCLLLQHDTKLLKRYTWSKCHASHPKLLRTMIRDFPDLLIHLLRTGKLDNKINSLLPLEKGKFALLHLASLDDKNADLVRELLKHHASPLQESSEYQSIPLQHAATLGNTKVIEALLDENNGVDPNTQARSINHRTRKGHGFTALELALSGLHLEAAQLLIERGATLDNDENITMCVDNIIKNSHEGNIDLASEALYLLLQNIPYRLSRPILLQDIANDIHSISQTDPNRIPKSHQKKLQRAIQHDQLFDSYRKRTLLWLKSFIAIYRVIRVVAAFFAFLHQSPLQKVDKKIDDMRTKLDLWSVTQRTTPAGLQSVTETSDRFRFFSSADTTTHRKGRHRPH